MIAQLKNINLQINGNKVLSNISLDLAKNKITTLIGPNGGGKTSIARILLEILKPNSGKVIKNSSLKIGYMPQKIIVEKTIPLTAQNFATINLKNLDLQYFNKLSDRLKIKNLLTKQVHHLSGGQMQKIVLFRALLNKPELLVLDEPTQYMDIAAIQDFYQILEEIRKQNNCSILLISHDLHTVMQKTDIVLCINNHICCSGSPELVNEHPEYLSLFGKKNNIAIYHHHHDHSH